MISEVGSKTKLSITKLTEHTRSSSKSASRVSTRIIKIKNLNVNYKQGLKYPLMLQNAKKQGMRFLT